MNTFRCDRCGRMFTRLELQSGEVRLVGGDFFCRSCAPSPASGEPVVRRRGGFLAGALLGLILGGGAALLAWKLAGGEGLDSRLAKVEAAQAQQARALVELGQRLDDRAAGLAAHLQALSDEERRAALVGTGRLQEALDLLRQQGAALAQDLAGLERRLQDSRRPPATPVAAATVRPSARPSPTAGSGPSSPAPVLPSPTPGAAPLAPEVQDQLIANARLCLASENPGRRFQGLSLLVRARTARVVPLLLRALEDPYEHCRSYAALALGDLGDRQAVGPLIQALRDQHVSVRQSAGRSLERLTGRASGFAPDAPAAEREEAVRRWEEWFRGGRER